MKKALAIVVALLMVMTLIPVSAGARGTKSSIDQQKLVAPNLGSLETVPYTPASREAMRDVFVDGSLLNESFEATSTLDGWWMYDADGDDDNWHWSTSQSQYAYDGSGFLFSYGYDSSTGSLNNDNWVITPDITVPGTGYTLSFYSMSLNSSYLSSIQVVAGVEGDAYDDESIYPDEWTTVMALTTLTGEYAQYTINLDQFAGETVAFGIRHRYNNALNLAATLDYVQIGIQGEAVIETGISLDNATLALDVTCTDKLTATLTPENASYQDVTWTTSDPTVAAVNLEGGVIGLAAGTATITATSHNGLTATCTVTVSEGDYAFATPMMTFAIYSDVDGSNPYNWYSVDQYGVMELEEEDGENYIIHPIWHAANELIYAYINNSTDSANSYDFVSIDPETMAITTINTLTVAPRWMTYDWQNNVVYGGFMTFDSNDNIAGFNISTIDLATGAEDEILSDVYNESYESNGNTYTYGFLPLHCTYAGYGIFIGADYQYNELIMYAPNYEFEDGTVGFGCGYLSDYELINEVGSVPSYIQAMYYNPLDGMLYWAYAGANCEMVVVDLENGIAVSTGLTALEGDEAGMELSGLFALYTVTNVYTVEFYDSITGELIASVEVEEGEAAEAPEAPVHEGYTFVGWDADFSEVYEDMTVYTIYEAAPAGLLGDVDCDGSVGFGDISALYLHLLGSGNVTAQGLLNADFDQDGSVGFGDISAIYLYLLGA